MSYLKKTKIYWSDYQVEGLFSIPLLVAWTIPITHCLILSSIQISVLFPWFYKYIFFILFGMADNIRHLARKYSTVNYKVLEMEELVSQIHSIHFTLMLLHLLEIQIYKKFKLFIMFHFNILVNQWTKKLLDLKQN